MDYVGQAVWTPYDARYPEFDPQWRYLTARLWADNPGEKPPITEVAEDVCVRKMMTYLSLLKKGEAWVKHGYPLHQYVMAWHGGGLISNLRFRIEAMLLTGVTFPILAADIGGPLFPPEALQLYERLFFNVRADDGRLAQSCIIRMNAALPQNHNLNRNTPEDILWKYIGMRFGYTGLVWFWGMPDPHGTVKDDALILDELWRATQAMMLEHVLRRDINNFDLNQLLGQYIDHKRMMHELGQVQSTDSEIFATLRKALEKVGPRLNKKALELDKIDDKTKAIQTRLHAQENVAKQVIPDYGSDRGVAALDEMIKSNFADVGFKP